MYISIHAPPRGATQAQARIQAIVPDFNSRPSARGDRFFQRILRWLKNFNSRPSARGDKIGTKPADSKYISIHAPPRGATRLRISAVGGRKYFNSRPSARGDVSPPFISRFANNFNSRPSARGDCRARARIGTSPNFNSRPSARGDSKRYAISANLLFNPYKSAWLNNRATQFVEIILVIFHRIIA